MSQYAKSTCPKCGNFTGLRIVYGFAPVHVWLMEEKGEVIIGSCCHKPGAPEWECKNCGHQWIVSKRPRTKDWQKQDLRI